jgi:4-hydroxy-tetrahydrodipicolinate synthase
MKRARFLTPIVTAFDAEGNLDIKANRRIYDTQIDGGIEGIVVMGSTGEFFSMPTEQKKELIDLALIHVRNRIKVYVGTGCMSVEDTIALSNYALEVGAEAVMIISPYYFALSDRSVEEFYDKVARAVEGRIYLYNYPARTGHDLSPEVTLRLLRKHKNIVGYKDTVTEMGHTRKLITTIHKEFPDFEIFSGFDENFVHNLISGGSGCIGGLSNLYPKLITAWVHAMNQEDTKKIVKIQRVVNDLMDIYAIGTPFIPVMKRAMMMSGVKMTDHCTSPFLPVDSGQVEALEKLMKKVEDPIREILEGTEG